MTVVREVYMYKLTLVQEVYMYNLTVMQVCVYNLTLLLEAYMCNLTLLQEVYMYNLTVMQVYMYNLKLLQKVTEGEVEHIAVQKPVSTFHLGGRRHAQVDVSAKGIHVQLDITAGDNLTVVQEVYMCNLTLLQETT